MIINVKIKTPQAIYYFLNANYRKWNVNFQKLFFGKYAMIESSPPLRRGGARRAEGYGGPISANS